MTQHTPLQQPRHASNPACRNPDAPRPTGSPITYYGPIGPSKLRLGWWFTGVQESPIIANGIAYVYTGDVNQATIYALDASTGSVRWKLNMPHESPSYPSIENGIIYFNTVRAIYALDASTGARRWTYGSVQGEGVGVPTVYGKTVFVTQQDRLFALGAMDGHKLWTYTAPLQKGKYNSFHFLPAVVGGTVYLANDDGRLYAIDSTKGICIWKANIGEAPASDPSVVNDKVFIASSGNSSGRLSAFNAESGKKLWDSAAIGDIVNSYQAVAAGMVFMGDISGTVYGINARTGAKNWSQRVGGEIHSALAVASGRVYVSSDQVDGRSGVVFALNQATGVIEDSFDTGSPYVSEPVVVGGAMYVTAAEEAANTSVLYAVG